MVPGTTGVPAEMASWRAAVLLPIASIASAGGPTQTSPASRTARANQARSERKPYPGCTAPAPVRRAASIRRSPTR